MRQTVSLVLASGSPRRRDLLTQIGLAFAIKVTDVNEDIADGESPPRYVTRVARDKLSRGMELARDSADGEPFVLAADTIVVVDDRILGKPRDRDHATKMLERLSGRGHEVTTAVALGRVRGGERAILTELAVTTRVWFRALSSAEISRYAATGEGDDKAGAYAVQGHGAALVTRMDGSYTNVVGLPLAETLLALVEHGGVTEWP